MILYTIYCLDNNKCTIELEPKIFQLLFPLEYINPRQDVKNNTIFTINNDGSIVSSYINIVAKHAENKCFRDTAIVTYCNTSISNTVPTKLYMAAKFLKEVWGPIDNNWKQYIKDSYMDLMTTIWSRILIYTPKTRDTELSLNFGNEIKYIYFDVLLYSQWYYVMNIDLTMKLNSYKTPSEILRAVKFTNEEFNYIDIGHMMTERILSWNKNSLEMITCVQYYFSLETILNSDFQKNTHIKSIFDHIHSLIVSHEFMECMFCITKNFELILFNVKEVDVSKISTNIIPIVQYKTMQLDQIFKNHDPFIIFDTCWTPEKKLEYVKSYSTIKNLALLYYNVNLK